MQAKACRYFLSRLDNGKCALLVLALRLACILQGYHMNAEEQEEPILRLCTLSGGRTGLGKWKVNTSFTGHAGLCMRAHRGSFLSMVLWTTRCRRGGHGGVESFQVAASGFGPSMLLSIQKLQLAFISQQRKGERKSTPAASQVALLRRQARRSNTTGEKGDEMRANSLVFVHFCYRASIISTTLENLRIWSVI